MNANSPRRMLGPLVLVVLGVATASAQPEIPWFSVDGGGDFFSTGGNIELSGTIGQPDAGVMSGGSFELIGGFWAVTAGVAQCPGDVDGNNQVDINDLTILLANFGDAGPGSPGDVDGDGDTDINDLTTLLANFGVICS